MKRLLKVLFLPADDGGCGYHRVRMWDKAFSELGVADSQLLDPSLDEKEVRLAIDAADVVVSRLNTLAYIKLIKKTWPNKVVVFDHDDNTLEVKPSNPSYKDFGTMDIWVENKDIKSTDFYKQQTMGVKLQMVEKNAIPLWVTGITPGFNRYMNLEQHVGLIYALLSCNLATSPAPVLTTMWSRYSDFVATIPNCLDMSYYPDVSVKRKRAKGEIRVGWSGGYLQHFPTPFNLQLEHHTFTPSVSMYCLHFLQRWSAYLSTRFSFFSPIARSNCLPIVLTSNTIAIKISSSLVIRSRKRSISFFLASLLRFVRSAGLRFFFTIRVPVDTAARSVGKTYLFLSPSAFSNILNNLS